MTALKSVGLVIGHGFPAAACDGLHDQVCKAQRSPILQAHYAGGLNATAFRFQGMVDAADRLDTSLATLGVRNLAPSERARQEIAIFDLYTNGLAVFETTIFGLHAVGGMADPSAFPMSTPGEVRSVMPALTLERFKATWPGEPLTTAIQTALASDAYKGTRKARNVLSHRAAPGRTHNIGVANAADVSWQLDNSELQAGRGAAVVSVVATQLAPLLAAAEQFAAAKL